MPGHHPLSNIQHRIKGTKKCSTQDTTPSSNIQSKRKSKLAAKKGCRKVPQQDVVFCARSPLPQKHRKQCGKPLPSCHHCMQVATHIKTAASRKADNVEVACKVLMSDEQVPNAKTPRHKHPANILPRPGSLERRWVQLRSVLQSLPLFPT